MYVCDCNSVCNALLFAKKKQLIFFCQLVIKERYAERYCQVWHLSWEKIGLVFSDRFWCIKLSYLKRPAKGRVRFRYFSCPLFDTEQSSRSNNFFAECTEEEWEKKCQNTSADKTLKFFHVVWRLYTIALYYKSVDCSRL